MKRSRSQWDKLYQNYSKKYDKMNADRLAKGLPGMALPKYDPLSYRNAYIGIETFREEQVAKGKRKVLNTQRDLLNDQIYQYSKAQARAQRQALIKRAERNISSDLSNKEFKKEIKRIQKEFSFTKVRRGQFNTDELYAEASALNKKLKNDTVGWAASDRAKIIGQLVFGSV